MMLDIVRRLYTRKLAGSGTLFTLTSRKSMRLYLRRSLPWDIIGAFPWYFVALRMNNHLGMEFPENFLLVFLFYTRNSIGIFSRNPILQQLARKLQRQLRVGGSFMNVFLFAGLLLLFLQLHACVIFFLERLQVYVAFFNSVANTFPVTGYKPSDALEQAATIVAVLIGALLYAALVGTISTFSLGLDTSGRKFKEKIDEVNEFMEERKLSSDVRRRVRKYFKLKYRGKYFDKASILSELNAPLRQQGEPGNDMYFIEHGTVDIVVNGNIVGALTDGAFFGEVALLDQSTRSATIKASSHTTLFKLSKRDFQLILEDFQDVEQKMRQVYEERLEKIRKEKEEKERNMVVAACSAQSTVRNPASIPPK
ncbi:cyclic nucleotide-binding-like protein [Chytridium lagenaria]|nr:cyclic nucleotide-binding-like protein [Chytridium lagenaria]